MLHFIEQFTQYSKDEFVPFSSCRFNNNNKDIVRIEKWLLCLRVVTRFSSFIDNNTDTSDVLRMNYLSYIEHIPYLFLCLHYAYTIFANYLLQKNLIHVQITHTKNMIIQIKYTNLNFIRILYSGWTRFVRNPDYRKISGLLNRLTKFFPKNRTFFVKKKNVIHIYR